MNIKSENKNNNAVSKTGVGTGKLNGYGAIRQKIDGAKQQTVEKGQPTEPTKNRVSIGFN